MRTKKQIQQAIALLLWQVIDKTDSNINLSSAEVRPLVLTASAMAWVLDDGMESAQSFDSFLTKSRETVRKMCADNPKIIDAELAILLEILEIKVDHFAA